MFWAREEGNNGLIERYLRGMLSEGGKIMASELFIGLHGSEDPTKATLPFLMASGALDAGHETAIILIGDAVVLMNGTVADNVQGIGFPPLKELMAKIVAAKVPIYI
jgi:predicted peroxiredoxin